LAAAFALAAIPAKATPTVQYIYTGETGGGLVMGIHTAEYDGHALVGEFDLTTSSAGWANPFNSYCTDVGVFFTSPHNYTPFSITDPQAVGVNPLWVAGGIQNAAKLWYFDKGTATSVTQKAGLQLAIWEVLNNTLGSYSSANFFSSANGGFHITSTDANSQAAVNYAVSVLSNLGSLPAANNVIWLAPVQSDGSIGGSQGLLYCVPDAASTLILLATAILALVLHSRSSGAPRFAPIPIRKRDRLEKRP
jgi:hypothetical protein